MHVRNYLERSTGVNDVLNCSYNGAEGVFGHDYVRVSVCEDGDCLAHLPRALGTLPLQGAGPLQLGGGIVLVMNENDLHFLLLLQMVGLLFVIVGVWIYNDIIIMPFIRHAMKRSESTPNTIEA